MTTDPIRQFIAMLLDDGNAHSSFEDIVAEFPSAAMNQRPPQTEYTPWHLLEHMRLTQRDILDYIEAEEYEERAWPEGYWPASDMTANDATWQDTIDGFLADRARLQAIASDPNVDLHAPARHAQQPDHTVLRQLIVIGKHTSYHLGEFGILRQVMGTWPEGHQ